MQTKKTHIVDKRLYMYKQTDNEFDLLGGDCW